MFPIKTFVSERRAANLLEQVRWRDGVYCPRCRGESVIRYGSYRVFQRYLCKDCDRTFNDQTGTIFEHSAVALRKWFLAVYTYIRFNTSLRQLDVEIDVSYKTIYRRVQRFLRALDAPQLHLKGPVEIDEFYVKAGLKGRERDCWSRSRGLSTRGRGTFAEDKPPVFVLADRGSGERYVVPAKTATESRIRLLLADRQQESLTVYTDGFRAYEPLEEDDAFTREYVVHGDGEYVDGDVHVNTCESHASLARRWLSPHRGVSKDRLTPYLRAFQLRREVFRKPGKEALKTILETAL
ncbi:transposase [Halorubrum ezzemoulense]|uniref:Transposase n=1 Tax=Halorubrum ezzemoulense TaxID=337243 RepID=A0A238YMM5_HALEZ|nr:MULTISPECIES: IS1595 family transposase [Halorubrum]TKX72051.1 IS1595 family transposase [Halorubrum sp. GN11_10-6_MGM]SNR72280.1 transposase [Halorubrum ezzemoulense]